MFDLSRYRPHDAQARFHSNGARHLAAVAGVRGGKTTAGAVEFLRRLLADVEAGRVDDVPITEDRWSRPRWHGWVCAPTYSLLDEPRRELFRWIPEGIREWREHAQQLWVKPLGALIEFKSTDSPQRLVSAGLRGAWIDEAARVTADAWRGGIAQRLGDKLGWSLHTTTPLGRGFVYSDIGDHAMRDPKNFGLVSWTTAQNPHFSSDELALQRATLPDRYFRRDYLADPDSFIGKIFDEWSPPLHVTTPKEWHMARGLRMDQRSFRRVVAGIDWGYTSPGAIVVVGDLGNELVVLEESYAPGRSILVGETSWLSECRRLQAKWGIKTFVGDPSSPGNINDLSQSGVPLLGAYNDIAQGVRRLSEFFHPVNNRPRLQVWNTCPNLVRELSQYEYDSDRRTGETLETPKAAQSDHAIDALRYAVMDLRPFVKNGSVSPIRGSNAWIAR